jgi:hypothetical protein
LPASIAMQLFFVELVQDFLAAAERNPTLVQPLVRTERHRCAEAEGRIPAENTRGVAVLNGAVLHGIDDLQAGHDLAGGIWNVPSVASATALHIISAPPNSVWSDFGQHRSSAI